MVKTNHIVLLGASVGNAWDIEALPKRVGIDGYRFEFVGEYQFDKTQALQKVLQRRENKPDAVFLKECAAYFPGNMDYYQMLIKKWVADCRAAKVIPILTTVVPVVEPDSLWIKLKEIAKGILGRPTLDSRLKGLLVYNDWVRFFSGQEKIGLLDLESELRVSEKDRRLRKDFHSGDGLHLNRQAYDRLDQIVIPTLEKAFSKAGSPRG